MFARVLMNLVTIAAASGHVLAEDPLRYLIIPVIGTVGADCTRDGVDSALALAATDGQDADAVLIEIDAIDGRLSDGSAIAASIREASSRFRTIAIVRNAGGAALPILWACDTWIVLDSITTSVDDGEGGTKSMTIGPDRRVLRTLPPLATSVETLDTELIMLRRAMDASMPPSLPEEIANGRKALARALCDRRLDLRLRPTPAAIPALRSNQGDDGGSNDRVRTSRQGPGIDATQLAKAKLCRIISEGMEPLAEAMGAQTIESLGDPGVLLVVDAADERFTRRGRVNSRIDSMIGSLDTADTLVSAMPWTVERARISDPASPRLLGNFPIEFRDGTWRIAPDFRRPWLAACDDSIRRWSGVVEIHEMLVQVLRRGVDLRTEIDSLVVGAPEMERHTAAIGVFDRRMKRLGSVPDGWESLVEEARRAISRLETWRESPPGPGA